MSYSDWIKAEREKEKKKKKYDSYSEWIRAERGISEPEEDDIAPVKTESEERTWLKKSEGDTWQTILGSMTDIGEHIGAGFMGIGEKIVDAGLTLGTMMNQSSMMKAAETEMMVNAMSGKSTKGVLDRYQKAQDEAEKETAEFVAKDLYDEEAVAKKLISDNAMKIGIDSERHSVFGEKSDSLAMSAGQLGGQLLSNAIVPGSGMVMMGATAFGSEAESALRNGADFDEAVLSSAISAGAEMLTEKIGGVKFGGKTLTDAAFGELSSRMTSKLARALVSTGKISADALAEGGEELLSGYLGAAGQKLTYMKDKEIEELFSNEDKLESFVGGVVLGGAFGGVETALSGRDAASGLTKHEQAVVDKVYNETIAQREANGKVLTSREKAKIHESVVEQMENGQIDIDTIESVLGGNTYKEYTKQVESEEKLKTELGDLRKMKASDMNDIQTSRMSELKGMNLDDTTKRDALRKKLDDTISPLLKDSKLSESYRERERRGQAFEADLSEYTGKQRKAVERAVKSGVLNNTYRSHELVNVLSKLEADKGIVFDYTNNAKLKESGFAVEGKTVNGFANKNKGSVTLNVQSAKAWQSVVGHEITHVLEGTDAYSELQNALYAFAESKGELESRRASLTELYQNMDADIESELTADLVGDYLFTDKEFINNLTGNRTLFQKIYDEIKYLWNAATGKEKTEIEKVKDEFDKAWREFSSEGAKETDKEVQYSLSGWDADGIEIYETSEETQKLTNKEKNKRIIDIMQNEFKGRTAKFVTDSQTYYAHLDKIGLQKGLYGDKKSSNSGRRAKVNIGADGNYIELVENAVFDHTATEYGKSADSHKKVTDWDYFVKEIASDGVYYDVLVNVRKTADGEYVYDVNLWENQNKKNVVPHVAKTVQKRQALKSEETTYGDSIAPIPENVNTQFSLSSDTNGNELSKEQQEYFKDSKVVDENGNLKVMYHGTPSGDFTVFRDGTYFTENKWYADLYQNPGASSINSRKTVTNPKTYEVYLDIKKPFDISDPEAREIYINEYIKGGNATGINPYLSDAEYDKISSIDWTEGEDLRDFLIDNEYDYDGLVLDEGAVGGYGDDVKYRGKSYVIFSPEQVKSVDNKHPTSDPDIRFSLSKSVEETKDLVALHNLQASELAKTIELGGLPMPSIAVIKDNMSHEQYGDVSLILPKEVIDPQANKDNKVYGGDAWTPTYPKIEYKPNEKVAKKISDKYYELARVIGYDEVRPMYRYVNELEEALNRDGGEAPMLEKLYDDTGMMNLYLQDSGKGKIEPITKETVTKISDGVAEMNQYFIDALGEDFVASYKAPDGVNGLEYRSEFMKQHEEKIRDVYKRYFMEEHGFTAEEVENVFENITKRDLTKIMRDAYMYTQNKGVTVRTETDHAATEDAIRQAASDGYKEWVDGLFKGIEEKSGIRNNLDYYTRSGNPRSWDALHWENTLENVVKVMKEQDDTGVDSFSPFNNLFGASHKQYSNIQEIKADSGRLGKINQEEYDAMKDSFTERFAAIADSIKDHGERNSFIALDTAAEQIVEAVRSKKTKTGILNHLKSLNSSATMQTVDDVLSLVSDIANMPTGYFEAKPKRAVGLDEVGVFVIPRNADIKLKQELLNRGYSIAEYDPDVEGDRQKVINQFEEYKFSLSNVGEEYAPVGDYSTPLKDLALEEDIAPVGGVDSESAPVPKSVRIANGERSDELLYESLDNYPMQTVEQKISEKLRATEAELADKRDLRKESWDNYENQIANLRARYNSKKNKNTKEASKILESISRIERLKASREAELAKGMSDLEARIEKLKDPKYSRAMQKQAKMEADAKWAADLLGDTSTWKDKKIGLQYATNTERRNLRDIVRDADGNEDIFHADVIDDALNGQYNRDEAAKKRELARVRGKYADLDITRAEDAYIQMLGEFRHNPDTTITEKDISEYYAKHKNKIDAEKVDKVIELARQDYDNLITRLNAELKKQGMREIPYRKGYFPHFTEPKQNFIQKLLNWKTQDNEIPTSIAGLTETFKPTRSWQSFDKVRHSDETDYSFMKGFDSYSDGALDWIYHMDTLQKRRAVENHIRFTHSDEGIKAKIKEVYANKEMDANEAQAQIEHILAEAKNPLNNFVQDFTTHTNILAGKKNSLDRTVEQWTNRHIYSVMTNVQNRLSANMVLANVRSALTNFIPITQSWAQVSPLRSLQAAKETIANSIMDDGTVDKSTFLTNRLREADRLYQTNWDKVLDKAGIMFEIVDNFSSQVIWRSKYNQNLSDGMSEAEAIRNADQFAENVMAGRSKGNEPTLFNAKNPLVKAFTMFQLEVNNQYGYLFKDVPNDLKTETNHWKFNLAKGYTAAFFGAYVYNALLEQVTGSDAALDPIGIIEELLRDLGLSDDDEEKEPTKVATNLIGNVVEELPFVGGVLGGGRIPISSAIPYGGQYGGGLEGFMEDVGNIGNGGLKNIGKEMMNPLLNIGLPVAGGQIKKSIQGLRMFTDDHPVSGSYTDSGKLRFPVEKTPLNIAQATVFGQYTSENAREYFDNDYAPLAEKQIQEYIDVDIPIKEYWKYLEGLNDIAPLPGYKTVTLNQKGDYVGSLDLPASKKNILINNIADDRKTPIDMTTYGNYKDFEEFDFAQRYPEKYAVLKDQGISVAEYKKNHEESTFLYTDDYSWAANNPDKYTLSKVISDDVTEYKRYTSELSNIEADKDSKGKSISGSRKEKVIDYINSLDIDDGAKKVMFKSQYSADNSYDVDIINYINSRSDLTYDEKVTILTEIGFRVEADGQIYTD